MQPTNDDVNYEKALQNYFHYDIEEVEDAALKVYIHTKSRHYHESMTVHKKVFEFANGHTLSDGFYHTGNTYMEMPFDTYKDEAYLVQEFLRDWNDVIGALNRECYAIHAIIRRGERYGDDGTAEIRMSL